MAIGSIYYDANRDMYVGSDYYRDQERQYRQHQEEMMRKHMQNPAHNPYVDQQKEKSTNTAPKPDLNDPLAFLQNTDKKLLLTGEMQ